MNKTVQNLLSIFIAIVLGLGGTVLQIILGVPPILASTITGILASLCLTKIFKDESGLSGAVYCASFAAIGLQDFQPNIFDSIMLVLIISVAFYSTRKIFIGFGGKLGTLAFISTGLWLILRGLV